MLASRTLPPIIYRPPPPPGPPPIATFVNIPRRYTKSNMQAIDHESGSQGDTMSHSQHLRKSSRNQESRGASPTASPARQLNGLQGPTSAPGSSQITRKRPAPGEDGRLVIVSDDGDSPTDSRAPQSASSTGSGESPTHVCLCQPEPKVPRPRNAFILYRQHHQHSVASRNPGLSNPDISKIIGEQWNSEAPTEKIVWQGLAQEEKAKHQEQYPDYRYQPRRWSKASADGSPAHQTFAIDKHRCTKCGGRSIRTLSPSSPFSPSPTPSPSQQSLPLLPPVPSDTTTPPTGPARYLPIMSLDSPAYRRRGPGPSALNNIPPQRAASLSSPPVRGPGPSNLSNIQLPSPTQDHQPPMYSPNPSTPGGDAKRRRYNYPTVGPAYYGQQRRDSITHTNIPQQLRPSPPHSASIMPPPPRTPRELHRRASMDLNVLTTEPHDQSRSVEAMVMSVPFPIKIKVLGRITPPFHEPGPTSPSIAVRGAIIAIEGDDLAAVKELSEWLNAFLIRAGEYKPRIAEPPRVPKDDSNDAVSFKNYLDLIKEWHDRSKDMIEYITTPVPVATDTSSPPSDAKDRDNRESRDKDKDTASISSSQPDLSKTPVIILPTYQLHASNTYTSRIPIQDAYSPTDHWQWMATLWRGTVGPDLTIYVQTPDAGAGGKEGKDGGGGGGGGTGRLVEVNEEVRCLTVRKEKGVKFEESALRRVGFEVSEWVREVGKKTANAHR